MNLYTLLDKHNCVATAMGLLFILAIVFILGACDIIRYVLEVKRQSMMLRSKCKHSCCESSKNMPVKK